MTARQVYVEAHYYVLSNLTLWFTKRLTKSRDRFMREARRRP